MSDLSAEPRRNAGALTIVGIALVLMILSALVAFLIVSRGGPIDGAARLTSAFGVNSVGADYAIVEQRKMPGGAELIVFEDKSAPHESAPTPATDAARIETTAADASATPASSKDASGASPTPSANGGEHVDWTRVPIPASTSRPRRVTFLFSAVGTSHEDIAAFFRVSEGRTLADLGPEGGKVTIASGKLGWRGFDASWVHERVLEKGGTFRDGMRVDLSLDKQPCVMTAAWTRGETASRAALDQVLASLAVK